MVTWYGLMNTTLTANMESGDKWYDVTGVWHEWTGTHWKELKSDEV